MALETLPATADRGSLIGDLEASAALLGTDIDAYKARIVALKRDRRVVERAIAALKRGDGLQPALSDGAPLRAVTHGAPAAV